MRIPMAFVTAALALAACANHGKQREVELGRIADWLPGEYQGAGSRLVLIPVSAPFIGQRVLYVERMNDLNQVLAQNLYSFDKSADEKAVLQKTYTFKDPQRWRRGYTQPEIFLSILREDVNSSAACDLTWSFTEGALSAQTKLKSCRLQKLEFDGEELKLMERGAGALTYRRILAE